MASNPPNEKRRSKWRRRLLIGAAVFVALGGLIFSAVAFVLAGLERPLVKSRVQAILNKSGIELDYARGEGSLFSGLHLEGVRIATPIALRAFAPDVVRVDAVDVKWGLSRLASGTPQVDEIVLHGVDVTVVLDASGKTSFDFDAPTGQAPPPGPIGPPKPLSQLLDALAMHPPLRHLTIDPIRAALLRTDHGQVLDTLRLDGLRVELGGGPATGGTRLALALGTPEAPLTLELHREGRAQGQARATLALTAAVQPGRADAKIELRLVEQNLAPKLVVDRLVSVDATVAFEPSQHRVIATLQRAELGDGSLRLSAEIERPDASPSELVVHKLDGTLDAHRLLALAPPDLAPLLPRLEGGTVTLHAEQLAIGAAPRVLPGGTARASGKLRDVHLAMAGLEAHLPRATLELSTSAEGSFATTLAASIGAIHYRSGRTRADAEDGSVELIGRKLHLDPAAPSGQLELRAHLGKLAADTGEIAIAADELALTTSANLSSKPPFAGVVSVDAAHLRVSQAGRPLVDDALHAQLELSDARPDFARLLSSRLDVKLDATLGALALALSAKKATDAIDYTLTTSATSLALVTRLLPSRPAVEVPWSKVALQLRSSGRIDGLSGPLRLRQDTQLELQRPEAHGVGGNVRARSLAISTKSSGTLRKHEGELSLAIGGLERDGSVLGDGKVSTSFAVDVGAPTAHVRITSEGGAAPGIDGKLDLGFDQGKHRLSLAIDAKLRKLDTIAPLVAGIRAARGFKLAGLEVDLSAHGEIGGVIDSFAASGAPRFARDPGSTAHGEGGIELSVRKLDWHDQDRQVTTPALHWKSTGTANGALRTIDADLSFAEVALALGPTRLELVGVSDELSLKLTGAPLTGQIDLHDTVSIHSLKQQLVPAYRTGDIKVELRAHRDPDGVVRLPSLKIENAAAGTTMDLHGGVDLGEDRHSLAVEGAITQDLSKLWTARQQFTGSGTLTARMNVESGDLHVFRTTSSLRIDKGVLSLPQKKIHLEQIDGEIPLVADVVLTGGLHLLRNREVNTYSELRFADQHPMLSRRSYLSIARVDTPWASIAPVAGNLLIDNNIVALSQLELGVRGGHVGGRAAAELAVQDGKVAIGKVQLNIRASGVRSSQGEPFDGNTAIVLAVKQRSVQGRAEILRIGRRHLLDLLDVVDPPRAEASINRVRRALALGYPDGVRLTFNRGFASAKITFGGIAKLLRIDEIRGIPMGPIIDRVLEPFDSDEEE